MTQATLLPNRGVVKITGKDRGAFLQGLITNDVHKITSEQAIYAALLSPQGKFQYDLFIVAAIKNGEETWLIECEGSRVDTLLKRLLLYKLRSDVTIENVSDHFQVFALWGSNALDTVGFPFQPGVAKTLQEGIAFVDPRLTDLGIRIILPPDKAPGFFESQGVKQVPFENYDLHRLKLGIPDGSRDVEVDRGILLEVGFDDLNAIDWNKGCYMGQELTARTRYRGLVRKRLIPVHIQGETPSFESPVFQGDAEVGEMRTAAPGWGIALLRLEALSKPLPFQCGNATLMPHIPQWMHLPSLTNPDN
ncbi:MAG: glycine cleavage system protein [Alphaproteobacteria bacterium]|jgi:folate-binding protein YgfZ|nr:glycine cleavage system protein [Alphaproteobacteria bacterium]